MSPTRFREITSRYPSLRLTLVGDFCLDRYLEIDPGRAETSIETGLEVRNVMRVRSQPGAAGTILNNLVALGVGHVDVVGFCGEDGEGYELLRTLGDLAPVCIGGFLQTPARRTFTYCKPLLVSPDQPPVELNRLDFKNWDPTPPEVETSLCGLLEERMASADAVIAMDQVDLEDTGVITRGVRDCVGAMSARMPQKLVLADSRRGLAPWPAVGFKMNAAELGTLSGRPWKGNLNEVREQASALALRNRRPVFVTLAEQGVVGADADGNTEHVSALPVRGPIDIVGAGDSVTANLTMALAAGATLREALMLAMAGANIVVHQLGTTGTASVAQLHERLFG